MTTPQRILVTGANGYLGAQLSLHLADKGHLVTAVCYPGRPNHPDWCARMSAIEIGSVADPAFLETLEGSFDAIVHLVSLDHRQSQQASVEEALRINVQPAWALLHRFAPKGLKTFLFFSTVQVYNALPAEIVTEDRTASPGNVYALTHSLSEEITAYFQRTTPVHCLTVRLSNSYGHPVFPENNCWWLAVNDLCQTAFKHKEIRLLSDGSPLRDFIHGSDVCRAVEVLLEKAPKEGPQTYHISAGVTWTLLELAEQVQSVYAERYGEVLPVCTPQEEGVTDFKRFSGTDRYRIDRSGLKALGFEPQCSLREGIHQLFDYFEQQASNA
jgi:UDP-glucose 4-epimerase